MPDAPTNVAATIGDSSASVSWSAPAFNGGSSITSYTVTSNIGGHSVTTSNTNATVPGLSNGTTYTFTVTATNALGTSTSSGTSNGVTPATIPSVPTNIVAVAGNGQVTINFTAPVNNGGSTITDYVVEYKLSSGGTWTMFSDGVGTSPSITVTGLANYSYYDFRIYARNIIGDGTISSVLSATPTTPAPPAQVLIMGFSDLTVSSVPGESIATQIRITNEGSTEYEYQYTWCVTNSQSNLCGGGDDIFSSTAAKLIQPSENFDTTLHSTVSTPGNYYFHLDVQFGSDSSEANQSFTAVSGTPVNPPNGGGGGGSSQKENPKCESGDLNCDGKINSIDFSILLYFWKSQAPFKNQYVDINKDNKVDSIDFSILLFKWGKDY